MKKAKKPPLPLTESQRAFVEKLLKENEFIIKYTIHKTLGDVYSYLSDECVGELCLLVCEKISVLEAHPNPKAWVIAAAKYTPFTVMKKNKKHTSDVPLEYGDVVGADATYEEAVYSIWLKEDVPKKLLRTLTKRETQVYRKLYIEKKDIETIAKELNLTPSTVRSFKKMINDKILEHIKKKI